MIKRIFKYTLDTAGANFIHVPRESKFLSCVLSPDGEMCVYYLVNPNVSSKRIDSFMVVNTGDYVNTVDYDLEFVTTLMRPGGIVWHIFKEANKNEH